ncbi:alpha-ketoglutarate-dependent dioxygenase alkB homolog 6 [Orussus abietinus]|uniref:alpha-ketoglutarate-dependent dioxygenase alkB homolog 6 n=1 Tax=Orussus abietinus TaxID=222816 RepID=UPI000625AAB2|nr:alpha-ketoglutarate-dependent dioxygenase alkB homolog 6 [Orussus abietinus]XP_012276993.1 alpha-ketoglutarate-dependent dioxygenase alkB homolog 6 [Orussus abietinus]XP_012276994.1 alpha-ketoglutarate-dependent dioxygenase alkB homolog 6 [Orussus abietinus]XP_012276996.1 alpha-ketoglutarate-dependent dioxygenase alkB homolog 6 [Orussus abietinus]XP_023287511.1 alpha-ketoglutarate-dependent dioxygenase alkB homolog 6 [Orussus abietinus]XP_023287512.1 alpha-ketoglutarate-dependent dioxygenas
MMEQQTEGNNEDKCKRNILSQNIVKGVSPLALYIPDFISEIDETYIVKQINSAPVPKWTQLSHRRLQNWGGIPHAKGMIAEDMPSWLTKYIDKICDLNVFEQSVLPNHVLINEYLPGQGIMAHSDGPLFHPIVTTISCGSHTLLDFYKRLDTEEIDKTSKIEFSFLLEPRSLLILQKDLYHNYLHSIAEKTSDTITKEIKNLNLCSTNYTDEEVIQRGTRLSLTIRHVPKTSKLKLRIRK